MKKIISLLLTVVMLISMIIVPAGAVEGNAAVFYKGAYAAADSWFNYSYSYMEDDDEDFIKRVNESGADYYGEFNYTQVFDFKVTDYSTTADIMTDFTFTNDFSSYHYGYSFTHKAFVVYNMYMPGSGMSSGYQMLGKMSYDLDLNTWYEMAIRFVGKTITIYLNGVEMLKCDLDAAYANIGNHKYIEIWDWAAEARPEGFDNDQLYFHGVNVDMYMDNMSFYSGDFNIATGTASETYKTDSDFTDMSLAEGANYCGFTFNDNFTCDPNGGTPKVTYDRTAAASHVHNWVLNEEDSSTEHCLVAGYDLYECSDKEICGASEERNYVAPLGHLPGKTLQTIITATETENGVEKRQCNREGCGKTYTTIVPVLNADTNTNKALHGYTDGGTNIYNGYMGIDAKDMMATEGGITVIADIMPVYHDDTKEFPAIGAKMGGSGETYFVGYRYDIDKFVIEYEGEILSSNDKVLADYAWAEWTFVRKDLDIALYINGELIVSTTMTEDVNIVEDDDSIYDTHYFVFNAPGTELLLDNVIVADPDYNMKTRAGVIYDHIDFNGDVTNDGTTIKKNGAVQFYAYNQQFSSGWVIESYNTPTEPVVEIHEDRAIKIDADYESGSDNTYASLWAPAEDNDPRQALNDIFSSNVDLEYTFDFYAYDWCTDEALLNGGSAYIGSFVNGNGIDSTYDNGFVGYDFIKQAAVIGSVSQQSGGIYGENNLTAPYTVEKDTWHNMSIRYKTVEGADTTEIEDDKYLFSIYMDGNEVLSKSYDSNTMVQYFIFAPNFVKAYIDNVTLELNGVVYDNNLDYTNDFELVDRIGMTYSVGGVNDGWSIVPGGKATHVYNADVTPATCLSDGWTDYTCSCGESAYTAYDQPAQGHIWDEGVVTTPATGTSTGILLKTCTVCTTTTEEIIPKAFTYGDVDGNGKIEQKDVSDLSKSLAGGTVTIIAEAADVDGNGKIEQKDVSDLSKSLAGGSVNLGPAA